jgi:hypothetical protein
MAANLNTSSESRSIKSAPEFHVSTSVRIDRRRFISIAVLAAGSVAIAGCTDRITAPLPTVRQTADLIVAPAFIPVGEMLLEDGSQMLLEDGTPMMWEA